MCCTIEYLLDDQDIRIRCRLFQQADDGLVALVGIQDENIPLGHVIKHALRGVYIRCRIARPSLLLEIVVTGLPRHVPQIRQAEQLKKECIKKALYNPEEVFCLWLIPALGFEAQGEG